MIDWYLVLVILHVVGTAIGAGGATLSDFLFFASISDSRINKSEFKLLHIAGIAIWFGLFLLIFSGIGFVVIRNIEEVSLVETSSKLQAKLFVVPIILLNGLFLHFRVFPLFQKHLNQDIEHHVFLRHGFMVFTTGAVSIVSWYAAMIIGAWRGLSVPFYVILSAYLFALGVGILVSNVIGRIKMKRIHRNLLVKGKM